MELLLQLLMVSAVDGACAKDQISFGHQFLFPVLDLIGMDIKLLG